MTIIQDIGRKKKQVYGFDVYGNRWVTSGYKPNPALTPQSQSAFVAATNRINAAVMPGFNYDAAGNLTSDATTAAGAMVYDAENRQTSYTKAAVTTQYRYDGDGRRVMKIDSTGTTVFVYNADGQLIAEYTDAATSGTVTTSYLTTDHLGSTRVVTDGSGVVKARRDYLPFGEEIESSIGGRASVTGYTSLDSTRQRFTSKERDLESGLDYFGMRYCSSTQGRFTSVDPMLESCDIEDPQSWHRYAYAFNNPLKYIDPTGGENEPANQTEDKKQQHPTIKFEVLGQVKILGKNVTVYVATGQTQEYRDTVLKNAQAAANLINTNAKNLTAEDKQIIGNVSAIAALPQFIETNAQFYAEGIKGIDSSQLSNRGVDLPTGMYFSEQIGIADAEVFASTIGHEGKHVQDYKLRLGAYVSSAI